MSLFSLQSPEGHFTYPRGHGWSTLVSGFEKPSSI